MIKIDFMFEVFENHAFGHGYVIQKLILAGTVEGEDVEEVKSSFLDCVIEHQKTLDNVTWNDEWTTKEDNMFEGGEIHVITNESNTLEINLKEITNQ